MQPDVAGFVVLTRPWTTVARIDEAPCVQLPRARSAAGAALDASSGKRTTPQASRRYDPFDPMRLFNG
jgi:hypothetical protein